MSKLNNLIGQVFGKLTVVKRVENDKRGRAMWLCKCECGNERIVKGNYLIQCDVKSCGCLKHEGNGRTHGLSKHRLHRIWSLMKNRCLNSKDLSYKNYGGRGITICSEWLTDFMNFYNWAITHGYSDDLTIDRIDNNGNYEPNNCRWATIDEQANNKRTSIYLTYNNETHTVTEWDIILNRPKGTTSRRYKAGWKLEDIFNVPIQSTETLITYKGETHTIMEWSEIVGINYSALVQRITRYNWSIEKSLTTPVQGYYKYRGKFYLRKDLCKLAGISISAFKQRLKLGWTVEQIVETSKRKRLK